MRITTNGFFLRLLLLLLGTSFVGFSILEFLNGNPPASPPKIHFEDATDISGIDYAGTSYGAAWGDANGDGYPDLWASGHSPMRMLVNQRDGTFADHTNELMSPIRYSDRHNAAWADIDNDGDEDLIQLSGADRGFGRDPNSMYMNLNGRFVDQAEALGLEYGLARARAAVWMDSDADGRLDLVITGARRPEAPPALFSRIGSAYESRPLGYLAESEIAQLAMLFDQPALQLIAGLPHALFIHELRGGEFVDVREQLELKAVPEHGVADVLVADLDNDLLQDIVFVRGRLLADVEQPDPLNVHARLQSYNNHRQRISFSGSRSIRVSPYPLGKQWWGKGRVFIGEQGIAPADFPIVLDREDSDNVGLGSGDKGLFLGYDKESGAWVIELRDPGWSTVNLEVNASDPISDMVTEGFSPEVAGLEQHIHWNDGSQFHTANGEILGERNCYGGAVGDFDNDMDLDLYLVCGGYLGNARNLLFENLGERRFRELADAGGAAGSHLGIGDSAAVADFDLDGFLDLFVRNGQGLQPFADGPDQLFHNLGTENHWIQLDLQGTVSNRNGIGARITVTCGKTRQLRVVDNGTHGYVQDFRRVHFGLGHHEAATSIEVDWPSGGRTLYRDLPADRVWVLQEDGAYRPRFPALAQP